MKVALYGHSVQASDIPIVETLVDVLEKEQASLCFEENFLNQLNVLGWNKQGSTFNQEKGLDTHFTLFISFGGDGTMLRAITFIKDLGIPIVGINTGRLGFLATFNKEEVAKVVTQFKKGAYSIEERAVIELRTKEGVPDFMPLNFALNEISVSRKDTTSMITIETHLDGEFLTSYWADGLIIATPTGSTGYSLSCGGPVIAPMTKSLGVTPIAPHNLNARPLVISDDTQIKLKVTGRENQHLVSLDSRLAIIDNETELFISKAPFKIKMVKYHSESFLKTLRNKLLWGEDRRN